MSMGKKHASVVALAALIALILGGCGGSSDHSTPSTMVSTPDHPVIVLPIRPRPPRSAIPIAREKLRETLAEPTSPASPAAVIRRLELLTDVLYQAGRCGEHEETCDYERWEKLAAKIGRQVIFWGFGTGESEVPALRRTLIEEGFHHQGEKHGYRSISARTWGQRLLVLEERRAAECRAIPTCPYEEREAEVARLRRMMDLPVGHG
jgi:hypothetical protein